jgi:predicted nucleotidyltransferase
MRISNKLKEIIKKAIKDSFGDVDIYLFGSRVDDTKKGGDIDIAIDLDVDRITFRKLKVKFLTNLLKLDYDIKIDIVKLKNTNSLLEKELLETAVKL